MLSVYIHPVLHWHLRKEEGTVAPGDLPRHYISFVNICGHCWLLFALPCDAPDVCLIRSTLGLSSREKVASDAHKGEMTFFCILYRSYSYQVQLWWLTHIRLITIGLFLLFMVRNWIVINCTCVPAEDNSTACTLPNVHFEPSICIL